jgi:hypothetical protein
MPSTSKKQHRFMEAIAHNTAFAKKVGVPQSVGKDFSAADKGRKFSKGGSMATKNLFKGKETYKEELAEAKAIKSGKITPKQYAKGEQSEKELPMKKMAKGGIAKSGMGSVRTAAPSKDGIAEKGKTKGKQIVMGGTKAVNGKPGKK